MKKTLLIAALLVGCLSLWAEQDDIVEFKPMKKVIHVDKLGLGESTPISHVLAIMPELLGRGTWDENVLKNFSIQVDFRDVGQSRDMVLQQTLVAEVDVIEISTNPVVSEQQNGTGGTINIRMKPLQKEGVSGLAILDAGTAWDVQPTVMVNYKTEKFTLRSSIRAQYYRPTTFYYSIVDRPDTIMEAFDTTHMSYKQETAKLYMQYKPTSNDELTVSLWESYARSQQWSNTQLTGADELVRREKNNEGLTAEAYLGYRHFYTSHKGELKAEMRYNYRPKTTDQSLYPFTTETNNWAHQLVGYAFTKDEVYKQDKDKVVLRNGLNVNYDFGNGYQVEQLRLPELRPQYDTLALGKEHIYASPFTEMNYTHGVWDLQFGLRYQYYRVNQNDNHNHNQNFLDNHTWTGNVSLRCEVKQDHRLRLIMARNIRRRFSATDIKIYPYYNADLNYIFDWGNETDKLMTSVSANYIYGKQPVGMTGTIGANAQLVYQHGIFMMTFTGNIFARTEYIDGIRGQYHWYYNLSWLPVLNLPGDWMLSANLLYNSKVTMRDETFGDCFYAQLRVSKQIGGWNIHLEADDIFGYKTYNTLVLDNGIQYKNLDDLYQRCLKIGFSYTF